MNRIFLKNLLLFLAFYQLFGCEQNYQVETSAPLAQKALLTKEQFSVFNVTTYEQKKDLDLLFIIDNSGSMGSYQQQLKDSFDAFVNTNLAPNNGQTPIGNFCVGVITSDAYLNSPSQSTNGTIRGNPYITGARKFCSIEGNQKLNNAQIIAKAENAINTVGTNGSPTEKVKDSFIKFLDTNETSSSKFFRKNTFKALIFISDEKEQSSTSNSDFIQRLESYFRTVDQLPQNQKPLYHVINVVNISTQANDLNLNNINWPELTQSLGTNGTMRYLDTDQFNDILEDMITTVQKETSIQSNVFHLKNTPIPESISVKLISGMHGTITLKSNQLKIEKQMITIPENILAPYKEDANAQIEIEYTFYP